MDQQPTVRGIPNALRCAWNGLRCAPRGQIKQLQPNIELNSGDYIHGRSPKLRNISQFHGCTCTNEHRLTCLQHRSWTHLRATLHNRLKHPATEWQGQFTNKTCDYYFGHTFCSPGLNKSLAPAWTMGAVHTASATFSSHPVSTKQSSRLGDATHLRFCWPTRAPGLAGAWDEVWGST